MNPADRRMVSAGMFDDDFRRFEQAEYSKALRRQTTQSQLSFETSQHGLSATTRSSGFSDYSPAHSGHQSNTQNIKEQLQLQAVRLRALCLELEFRRLKSRQASGNAPNDADEVFQRYDGHSHHSARVVGKPPAMEKSPTIQALDDGDLRRRIAVEESLNHMLRQEMNRRLLKIPPMSAVMEQNVPIHPEVARDRPSLARKMPRTGMSDGGNTRPRATKEKSPRSIAMALKDDENAIARFQQVLRKSLEFFEVGGTEVPMNSHGRSYKVQAGQVGVRCRYCAHVPMHRRGRGSLYFPSKIDGVYQAAQNVANNHLLSSLCTEFPGEVLKEMERLRREPARRSGGGKRYWEESCRYVGVYDREDVPGLWFR